MKKLLLVFFMLISLTATAYDFTVDGIYYKILSSTEETVEVISGIEYSGSVVIPAKVKYGGVEYSVTSIGEKTFYECSGLTSITIPESVTSIGYRAFYGCGGLTSITIPEGVTSIGSDAFSGCSGLKRVNISNLSAWCSIEYGDMGSNPLFYAQHLYLNGEEVRDLVIPEGVTSIGQSAFSGCSGLTSITIPASVTSIDEYAFVNCSGLTSITIPEGVTSIGRDAFYYCEALKDVYYEGTQEEWDAIVFSNETSNPLYYGATLHLVENGSTITELETPKVTPHRTDIYDLMGRRLSAPQHGINIINGKKVLVK